MNIENDCVLRLLHKAHAKKLTSEEIKTIVDMALNIEQEDYSIFSLIDCIGYMFAFYAAFEERSKVFEKVISWVERKSYPALSGSALKTLVVNCGWQDLAARDNIVALLKETSWDEGYEAVDLAISAAAAYRNDLPADDLISGALKDLLNSKNTPKITRKIILDNCARYL